MSRFKYLFAALFAVVISSFWSLTPKMGDPVQIEEKLTPAPMPLYQGNLRLPVGSAAPQPHRDESVKRWLIPSVRIRVPGAAGSGTICHYDRSTNTAWVISCAHLFRKGDNKATVEVFYKNNQKLDTPAKYEAKVISFKVGYYSDDISFMTFQPDWIPQTWFPIAPVDHPVAKGEIHFSAGCDGASEVACYFVRPQGIDGAFLATRENSPRPGRSGGGLFDKDGWYVGICVRTSDVSGNGTGFFVHLKTIHDYCRANGLTHLLNLQRPNDLLRIIPIVDRTQSQGNYPPDYVPVP
jgi:hypothetical protein